MDENRQENFAATTVADMPASTGVLGVATTLVGVHRLDDMLGRALAQLQRSFPGTLWAVFDKLVPGHYRVKTVASVGDSSISAALQQAGLGHCAVLREGALGDAMPLVSPRVATHSAATNSPTSPDVILAAWPVHVGAGPSDEEINLAAQLLSNARAGCREVDALRTQNTHDTLTRVLNRAAILEELRREKARAGRYQRPLSVLFIDVDKFKQINDQYGHRVGDEALVTVARVLEQTLRAADRVGRFGGDEFLLVLPDTSLSSARRAARRIQEALKERPVSFGNSDIPLSVTVGASCVDESSDDLVALADKRMLASKRRHRSVGRASHDGRPYRFGRRQLSGA